MKVSEGKHLHLPNLHWENYAQSIQVVDRTVCVCICVCYMYTSGGHRWTPDVLLSHLNLILWDGFPHCTWSSLIGEAEWLQITMDLSVSILSNLPALVLMTQATLPRVSSGFWGFKLGCSCLHSEQFANWDPSITNHEQNMAELKPISMYFLLN